MAAIVRATTPTIKYKFSVVDVQDISEAYLTVRQNGSLLFEKDLSDAYVGTDYLSWTFTQAETLQMTSGRITMMLNWKTENGTRGASEKSMLEIDDNYKAEVI